MGLPALEQELERLRAQLADLSSHYTDRHPDVRKVKEQIAEAEKMKQQITADLKAKASAPATDDNSTVGPRSDAEIKEMSPMVELESQLKVNRIEIANRERDSEELRAKISGVPDPAESRASTRTTACSISPATTISLEPTMTPAQEEE